VEKGSYRGRRVSFEKYAASLFNPYLFPGRDNARHGCGASALALLTGVDPKVISAKNGKPHYSDQFMVRFLRSRGFSVLTLTWCNVSVAPIQIGRTHVVLLSQLFRRNEGTWGIVFNGFYYHNFDIFSLEELSFLNKPVLSAFLVMTPSWHSDEMPGKAPAPKLKIPKKPHHFADLHIAGCARP